MHDSTTGEVGRLDWLDYGRFVCALCIMLFHYLVITLDPRIGHGIASFGLATEVARFGPISLSVFLMMSGLVITMVAQRQSAATFVTHRVARIYPTFLVCMTITALLAQFGPARLHVSLPQYFANFAINAPALGYRFVDSVYWTLVIEVTFYAAMLLVIMTGAIRRIQTVVTVWIGLQLACVLLPWRLPLVGLDYYFLAAGSVMALFYQRRNPRLNLALLAISLLLCLRSTVHYASAFDFDPVIGSLMTVLIFALFLFMRGRNLRLPYARRIGSMTYALYLLHFKIGLVIFFLWINEANKWWMVAGVASLMIAVSFVFDDLMEFRLRPLWQRLVATSIARPFAAWDRRVARRSAETPPVA